MSTRRIAVLGIGNVLMGDDGAGPHCIHRLLERWVFPRHVEIEEIGTPGPELTHRIRGLDALILVDAVRFPDRPGSVRRFTEAELVRGLGQGPSASPHDPGLVEALLLSELVQESPSHVVLVGIVPKEVAPGTRLSKPVRRAMAWLEAAVLAELHQLGVEPRKREEPRPVGAWWAS